MDLEFGVKTVFHSVMAQILPRLNIAYLWPSPPPPPPPPPPTQPATTTILDLESQQEIIMHSADNSSPPPPPPTQPATTTILDLESQQEIIMHGADNSSPARAAQSQNRDAGNVIMAFCFTAVLEIALQTSCDQPIKPHDHHHQLPEKFDFLLMVISFTFSTLFISKFINSKFLTTVQLLEQVGIFFSVTAFFVVVSIQLPIYLKFANWAIYAISLFIVWVSNKGAGILFRRS